MVAEVIRLRSKQRRQKGLLKDLLPLSYWMLNLAFLLDASWHVWALATNHTSYTLISKFLLGFTLAVLLKQQLREKLPLTILIAILFCLAGDILLQPLDLNYADMSGDRPVHFMLGVFCFCVAYGNLMRYYLELNPDWSDDIKTQPWPLAVNVTITLVVLIWMTLHSQAQPYLLYVLWLYSPVVVGAATLAIYTRRSASLRPFLALVAGSNVIVFSDTVIGLSVFDKISMPWLSNPVWILSSYIAGIFLIFNAVIFIEKRAAP
jgi:hypothetical protein